MRRSPSAASRARASSRDAARIAPSATPTRQGVDHITGPQHIARLLAFQCPSGGSRPTASEYRCGVPSCRRQPACAYTTPSPAVLPTASSAVRYPARGHRPDRRDSVHRRRCRGGNRGGGKAGGSAPPHLDAAELDAARRMPLAASWSSRRRRRSAAAGPRLKHVPDKRVRCADRRRSTRSASAAPIRPSHDRGTLATEQRRSPR